MIFVWTHSHSEECSVHCFSCLIFSCCTVSFGHPKLTLFRIQQADPHLSSCTYFLMCVFTMLWVFASAFVWIYHTNLTQTVNSCLWICAGSGSRAVCIYSVGWCYCFLSVESIFLVWAIRLQRGINNVHPIEENKYTELVAGQKRSFIIYLCVSVFV